MKTFCDVDFSGVDDMDRVLAQIGRKVKRHQNRIDGRFTLPLIISPPKSRLGKANAPIE